MLFGDHRIAERVVLVIIFDERARELRTFLNAEALRTGTAEIEVETSLTAFVHRIGLCRDGRSIRLVKDQLARLSAAQIRLSVAYGETQARQVNTHVVGGFDHATGQGANSKWGIWGHSLSDFEFRGVRGRAGAAGLASPLESKPT